MSRLSITKIKEVELELPMNMLAGQKPLLYFCIIMKQVHEAKTQRVEEKRGEKKKKKVRLFLQLLGLSLHSSALKGPE